MVHPIPVASLTKISLSPMEFPLVLIIYFIFPCRIPSRILWVPFKKEDVLSTDLRVQKCTKFMRSPLIGPLIMVMVIPIRYKYQTLYISPKDVNGSSTINIGHRTQHPLIQMLPTWMEPSVSLIMIMLT